MQLSFWQVNAFTNEIFKGNPAAVFILEEEISDEVMRNIAIAIELGHNIFLLYKKCK